MRNPIILAVDVPNREKALSLAGDLTGAVGAFKIGSELFTSAGPEIVWQIRAMGAHVFLDLKFLDIPNTVRGAVAAATRLDVQLLTVHCCGGFEMLRAAEAAAQDTAAALGRHAPVVLGVTVLTSMDQNALEQTGVPGGVEAQVERLARLAVAAGLRGLVCSPLELPRLRQIVPEEMQLVTPGIRATGEAAGDQKRTLSAAEAVAAGADWVVIGRPICEAPHPRAAAEQILASMTAGIGSRSDRAGN